MLFLACGLFDTSSGTSSTPTTAQASSEELVRKAFAEFDRACEDYYKISADVREWIYVEKNGIQIFNETSKEYSKKAYNLKIYANHTSGTNLLDDESRAKAEADLANINLKKYYDETLDKNEKEEANKLYDEVTKTERELNRLSEDESLVHAFYKVVKERYNAMPEKMRNSIKEYEEDINFNSIYPNYREHGKKKADFEKAYQKICVYYNQMHRDKLQRNGKSLPSEYQENGAALNQEVNELISNYVDAKTTKEKNSAYELLTSQYNASDFIYNNHKIDSDLQLYRWFVKAQKHKGNIRDQV